MEIGEGVSDVRSNVVPWKQLLPTIIANMSTLAVGTMLRISVHYSEVKMTNQEEYLLFGFIILTSVILGLLLSYFFCEYYGRKKTLSLSTIPLIISWVLIAFVDKQVWINIAFCVQFLGCSMCSFAVQLYVSEISCDSIRGALCSVRMIFLAMGFTFAHLIVLQQTLKQAAYIVIFFPFIPMIGMCWMPESPVFLVEKSRIDEATRSLLWLRNNDERYVQNELLTIKQTIWRIPNSGSCLGNGIGTIRDLFRDSANRRSFFIALGLLIAQSTIRIDYTHWTLSLEAMQQRGVLEIALCKIIPILGSALATLLIDCVGRRRLLLLSCVVMFLDSIIYYNMECYRSVKQDRVAEGCIYALASILIIAYHLGLGTISSVIAMEVFQRKVLSLGYMICLVISWNLLYIYTWFTRYLFNSEDVIQLERMILCMCLSLFTYFLVPETKGKAMK